MMPSHQNRHLAQKWASTYVEPHAKRRLLPSVETELASIENLILLDLEVGANDLEASYGVAHAVDDILGNGDLFARFVVELSVV